MLLLLADFRSPDVLRDLSRLNRGMPLPNGFVGFFELDPGLGMRLSAELLFFLPRDACRSTGDCIAAALLLGWEELAHWRTGSGQVLHFSRRANLGGHSANRSNALVTHSTLRKYVKILLLSFFACRNTTRACSEGIAPERQPLEPVSHTSLFGLAQQLCRGSDKLGGQ